MKKSINNINKKHKIPKNKTMNLTEIFLKMINTVQLKITPK